VVERLYRVLSFMSKSENTKYLRSELSGGALKRAQARDVVNNAIKAGSLNKGKCRCGSLEVEAHHKNYDKPLDVSASFHGIFITLGKCFCNNSSSVNPFFGYFSSNPLHISQLSGSRLPKQLHQIWCSRLTPATGCGSFLMGRLTSVSFSSCGQTFSIYYPCSVALSAVS